MTLLSYLLINLKKGRLGQTKEDVRSSATSSPDTVWRKSLVEMFKLRKTGDMV